MIADGIITQSVDVTFALVQRRGTVDTTLVTWSRHFDAKADFSATPYEVDEPAIALDFEPGDLLVYRYTGTNSTQDAYFPAADGTGSGRDTQLTLPVGP